MRRPGFASRAPSLSLVSVFRWFMRWALQAQRLQITPKPFHCLRPMAQLVLDLRPEFSKGLVVAERNKEGIVAKPPLPCPVRLDTPLANALEGLAGKRGLARFHSHTREQATEPSRALFLRHVLEQPKQL